MRKIILALAILALLAVTVYAADKTCSSADDCNTKQSIFGEKYQACDTSGTEGKCKDSSAKSNSDKADKYDEHCVESVFHSGESKCFFYGSKGCKRKETVCAGDTLKDDCDFQEEPTDGTDEPSAGEGDRCGGSKASEKCKLGEDLECSKHDVCFKKPGPYEPCIEGKCQTNLACHYGICVPSGTIGDGQFASAGSFCESGDVDGSGRCKPTSVRSNYRQQCQSNSQCEANDVCDMDRVVKEGWGTCVGADQHAALELAVCQGQRCVGDENNKNCLFDEAKCLNAKVREHCSKECKKHPQSRVPFRNNDEYKGDRKIYAYSIDCGSGSATPLEDNQCELKPEDVIRNCESVFGGYRENSASSLSGNFVAIIAAAAALVAFVF